MGLAASPVSSSTTEQQRIDLDRDRLALDKSFAQLWGPIVLPATLAALVPVVTLIITKSDERKAKEAQRLEISHHDHDAADQRALENGRAALNLYFDKLGNLRTKTSLTDLEAKRFVTEMRLIQGVSRYAPIDDLLTERYTEGFRRVPAPGAGQPDPDRPLVSSTAPSLIATPPGSLYTAQQFIAFPQAPTAAAAGDVTRFAKALIALGFNVQGMQRIGAGGSPQVSEVRFYRDDQRSFAAQIAGALQGRLCTQVRSRRVRGDTLPNGVMEFWFGENANAHRVAACKSG